MKTFVITIALLLSSCSVLLPYHENKLCERGATYGVCGRVSAVYEDTVKYPCKYTGIPDCVREEYIKSQQKTVCK